MIMINDNLELYFNKKLIHKSTAVNITTQSRYEKIISETIRLYVADVLITYYMKDINGKVFFSIHIDDIEQSTGELTGDDAKWFKEYFSTFLQHAKKVEKYKIDEERRDVVDRGIKYLKGIINS